MFLLYTDSSKTTDYTNVYSTEIKGHKDITQAIQNIYKIYFEVVSCDSHNIIFSSSQLKKSSDTVAVTRVKWKEKQFVERYDPGDLELKHLSDIIMKNTTMNITRSEYN